ncbi:DUF4231 domain-containing protein [Sorangium sp. KYC3313]|uniref:DUF4231 domain-containing protein n=1 Tax=Sorangium sp. KYC3313 TaxID=3449740 RepID=UPI003F89BFDD
MSDTPRAALKDAFTEQRTWSATASYLKRGITLWRSIALGLLASGALLQTAASQLDPPGLLPWLAQPLRWIGAAALACVPLIHTVKLGAERLRDWTRARAVAEGLKHEIYLYRTGTEPYDGADAESKLRARSSELAEQIQDLQQYAAMVQVPPGDDDGERLDAEAYFEDRVEQEIRRYYEPQAARLSARLRRSRQLEFILGLLSAALGAVAALQERSPAGAWVAAATTVAAALSAHVAAARYEQLALSYRATAARLRRLRGEFLDAVESKTITDAMTGRLIRECERAIAIETEHWITETLRVRPAAGGRTDRAA